jgi:hypothetical protein
MGSRLTEIVGDCHAPVAQAACWAAGLDYRVVCTEDGQVEMAPWEREPPDLADPEGNEFCVLGPLEALSR